jgi:uncharacterized protein YndB with AHSA1/START domain
MEALDSILVVRRSIFIEAQPTRVWEEFTTFDRMNGWWGRLVGDPVAGEGNGQRLVTYEPREGGRIEMEVAGRDGSKLRYGGAIRKFTSGRELTFDSDWIPNQGWREPTHLTIRLSSALGGTVVEVLHHGFERASESPGEEFAGYEAGWGMLQLTSLRDVVQGAPEL